MGRSFLLLGALLLASTSAHVYNQTFSSKVAPCDNFYKYVCNPEENGADGLFVNIMKRKLFDETLDILQKDGETEFVLREIVKQHVEQRKETFYMHKGYDLGTQVAEEPYGAVPLVHDDYHTNTLEIDFRGHYDPYDSHEARFQPATTTRCKHNECHPFYQGIASGYLAVVDIYQNMNLAEATLVIHATEEDLPKINETDVWKKQAYTSLLTDFRGEFTSHMNMIIGSTFFKSDRFSPKLFDELHEMYSNIADEVSLVLKNSTKLKEDQKKHLLSALADIKPHFGLPEVFTQKHLVTCYFTIARMTVIEGISRTDYYKKNPWERIDALAQMLQLAAKRFRAKHPEIVGDYGWTKGDAKQPYHASALQFGSSVWYNKNSVFFYPSLIQAAAYDLPHGFKYGFIGTVIADDLFRLLNGANLKHQDYKEAFKQIEQLGQTAPVTTDALEQKRCHGLFTDTDVSRVVYEVLQKARRNATQLRAKRFAVTTFNDREWFFIGIASRFCKADRNPFEYMPGVTHFSHPFEKKMFERRTNEVVAEMSQFAKLFQCPAASVKPSVCGFIPDEETHNLKTEEPAVEGSGTEI
uniref:Peptidase_M13 domain-containing protein n=1 Tax=Steinernema glaseri TaxID=37863 RepID=A0A1I7ZTW1_9BILA